MDLPASADAPGTSSKSPGMVASCSKSRGQPEIDDKFEHKGSREAALELNILTKSQTPADAPPVFAEHHAEVAIGSDGDVVTHDAHLNNDGEVLLRFLAMHARQAPELALGVHGEHTERESYTAWVNGRPDTRWRTYTVVDFDFTLPITESGTPTDVRGHLFVVPPELPAWRGIGHTRRAAATATAKMGDLEKGSKVETSEARLPAVATRKLERQVKSAADNLWATAKTRGYPLCAPWSILEDAVARTVPTTEDVTMLSPQPDTIASEMVAGSPIYLGRYVDHGGLDREARARKEAQVLAAAREWSDAYCANASPLKSFKVKKVCDSFDFERVESTVYDEIRKGYPHSIRLSWHKTSDSVLVMPDTTLARVFTLPWYYKALLYLALGLYPLLLLVRWAFFGARYEVVMASFPLSRWVPTRSREAAAWSDLDSLGRQRRRAILVNAKGEPDEYLLVGITEDEWLARWIQSIRQRIVVRSRNGMCYT